MAQPDREESGDDALRSALATLRELLTRSVTLPSDRLRDALDDAVRRGRMTRDDADDLIDRLLGLGRQQTDDVLARLDQLGGGGRVSQVVTDARDRVRRVAGLGGERSSDGGGFPIDGYDELTAAQVMTKLSDLDEAGLRQVRDHEKRHANRRTVLGAVDRRLRAT